MPAKLPKTGSNDSQIDSNYENGELNFSYSLGIDIGYSSIKIALLDEDNNCKYSGYTRHKGKIKENLHQILTNLSWRYNFENITIGAVTGSESKFLTENGTIQHINEVSALVEGSLNAESNVKSIIEIGGESAKYITGFTDTDKSAIKISMNSNCSAGTGSFLEEQASRLNLNIEDYSSYAARAKSIPRIAGRCSVFAKTDIIHHQQEGVPLEDILLGLAYAVIRNYRGAVIKKLPLEKPIMLTGGVAYNKAIGDAVRDVLNLNGDELIVSKNCGKLAAIGAAKIAKQDNLKFNFSDILRETGNTQKIITEDNSGIKLPKLKPFGSNDSKNKHICTPLKNTDGKTDCYLGIDIGSTSINLVLTDKNNVFVAYRYVKTLGDPVKALKTGFDDLKKEIGDRANIVGAGITGSGRYMIGRLIGADVIKDEITAQAKAAVTIKSNIDTVFEIGGQDSKYISFNNGVVTDFQMNKICAAGTGSFIEEQSKKFDIPIDDFGEMALNSENPINLGERCTVFIETSIAAHLSRGAEINDIASGLCYSIVKNYLNRVVGQKKIGDRIFLQGGIAHNQGILNAFRALTGKEIIVPPFFSVTGAYGAAIIAKEEIGAEKTKFKGFELRTDQVNIGDGKRSDRKQEHKSNFYENIEELIFADYDSSVDENKKTVGIPRALFTYGMFPMFNAFFRELGFNVILSEPTTEETIRLSQEYSLDETCYPVKLINGHVAELMQKNVDYIFFPDLYTACHPDSNSRKDYGCAYMQLAFKMISRAMEIDKKEIQLLSPTIAFNLGEEFMKKSFQKLGYKLDRNLHQTVMALQKGMKALCDFEIRMEEEQKKTMEKLQSDKKAFVLISKIYGAADPALNLGIPDLLTDMGYNVLGFYNLPECDISGEHPNMFWPFGQHILEAAKIVKEHPNLYPIFLTHHGCGPDTVFSHYFREIMDGKPYLNIEVDEHSSGVGVITRVEAFVNSLNKVPADRADATETYQERPAHNSTPIKTDLNQLNDNSPIYLPQMHPYSEIYSEVLKKSGIDAKIMPKSNKNTVDLGRKYTVTNEYFSLAAMIGDTFNICGMHNKNENTPAFLIPQSEGAEVDAQYNRLIRTILDEKGFTDVDIVAPFVEDLLYKDEQSLKTIFLTLLAGDIIRTAPEISRNKYLETITGLIKNDCLNIDTLKEISNDISAILNITDCNKTVFAIGEPLILFNDYLNNHTFKNIEEKKHRVVYAPFSEYMWLLWNDFMDQNKKEEKQMMQQKLEIFKDYISQISLCFKDYSPFEKDLNLLAKTADKTTGYYAGAFGRYRLSKTVGNLPNINGIITVASMYENTGIVLDILHKEFENERTKPVLNLTFDGNKNENDETKIESFLYYI